MATWADGHPSSGIGRGFAARHVQPLVDARSTVVPSITPQPAESGAGAADEYAAIFHSAEECGASGSSTESELSRSESIFRGVRGFERGRKALAMGRRWLFAASRRGLL